MLRASRCRLILMVSLLAVTIAAEALGSNEDSYWLISPELLKQASLKVLWQNQLPLKKGEMLERLLLWDNYIYGLSDKNFLVCLDRQKGNMIFGRSIAPAGFAVVGIDLYRDELISIIANKLTQLDPRLGTERRVKSLEFAIACPAARNSSFFYLAGTDRRLHALHAGNLVQAFEVAARNDSMITSIIADERFVIFGTDAGNVVSIAPDRPYQMGQFNAADAVAGPIIRDGASLFFASKDTHVYRVNIGDMPAINLVWKCQMPGILGKEPRVTSDTVYQYAGGKGVTAIDADTGKYIWSLEEGVDLLAEAAGKAYVITKNRTLTAMDNSKAKKLYAVNFARVSRHASNRTDSKIYVADEHGRVACLEPSQ